MYSLAPKGVGKRPQRGGILRIYGWISLETAAMLLALCGGQYAKGPKGTMGKGKGKKSFVQREREADWLPSGGIMEKDETSFVRAWD